MDRREKLERLTEYAAEQAGIVTSRQAARLGLRADDLVQLERARHLRRLRRGVYAFDMGRAASANEDLLAAYLAVNSDLTPWDRSGKDLRAVVSHGSAAALHGIGTVIAELPELTQREQRSRKQADMVVHTAEFTDADWQWLSVDGFQIAVTTPARTIIDLLVDGTELDYLRRAISDVYRERGYDAAAVELTDTLLRRRTLAHARARVELRRLIALAFQETA
jgi:predicted transcriptional regulator of viral defense system